ncbi:MAG TPA: hypothetical protein VM757_01415 [Sphingomicrobium sp.]|nr:hypothetical protein [Sphingomicrobium sp.]
MVDEQVWKRRFLIFALVRLFGLAMVLLGAAIAYTDLLREGGWPVVGAIIAIMGLIDAVFSPRLLRKAWDEEDRRRQ